MSCSTLMLHRCTNVRLASTYVSNANSLTLIIEQEDGDTEVTLFGLPFEVTDKFERFRDDKTTDYRDDDEKEEPPSMAELIHNIPYDFANRGK